MRGSMNAFPCLKACAPAVGPPSPLGKLPFVELRKSPLKAEENDEDRDGRAEISLAGEVIPYRFMLVVRVGEVDSKDGALIGELVVE